MAASRLRLCFVAMTLAPEAFAEISGRVVDQATEQPVVGALVSVRATDLETLSDAEGRFALEPPPDSGELTIAAAKHGFFNGFQLATDGASDLRIGLETIADEDATSYEFLAPTFCRTCHPNQYSEWEGSAMAHAGLNTWVYDVYDGTGTPGGMNGFVYTRDSKHAEHNPNSECASCHQPEPWAAAPFIALGDLSAPTEAMQRGVSCDLCHKVASVDETKINFPGLYPGVVKLSRPETGWVVQYGLLGDVSYTGNGEMRSAYQPELAAEVCGACHQDKNDHDADGDFEDPGGVISEPTYLEWKNSAYADPVFEKAATCVDCHMPATKAWQACNQYLPFQRPETDVRSHAIAGTTAEFLDDAIELSVTAEQQGDVLAIHASITNTKTGHHVPTGVTIRNMILLVSATLQGSARPLEFVGTQTVHELGGVGDPAAGYFAGLPGKLYANVNHGADGKGPVFFTDATGTQFDNRIAALATDETDYAFRVPAADATVVVDARVIYRRSWRALVDAKAWEYDGHGNALEDLEPPHFGHLMEQTKVSVDVEGTGDCGEGGCGGEGGSAGDGAGSGGEGAGSGGDSAGASGDSAGNGGDGTNAGEGGASGSSGGSGGRAGEGGEGGSGATGGEGGGTDDGGNGGGAGSGGSGDDGGASGEGGSFDAAEDDDAGGACGCRVAKGRHDSWLLCVLASAALAFRRRRSRLKMGRRELKCQGCR